MAKKRKSIATTLDEVDRTMYASFCTAASSLSHLYTQATNHHKLSFQAGQRHALVIVGCFCMLACLLMVTLFPRLAYDLAPGSSLRKSCNNNVKIDEPCNTKYGTSELEKLHQWIWGEQEGGSRVATVDILNYIQNELDYCGEEPSMSPRALPQHSQPVANSGFPVSSGSSGLTVPGQQGLRPEQCDNQSKNSVFSNALSSPIRRSLQHYQISEQGNCPSGLSMGNGNRNSETSFLHQQGRDSSTLNSNDSAMDMHSD
ncbi:unnamed protein product [Lupinus luteus]|uniref:Uncharacterized protein n=1 Tax=Lupinus luteus TaxID=3873 RepID=A0AAV1VUN6_LUPLU